MLLHIETNLESMMGVPKVVIVFVANNRFTESAVWEGELSYTIHLLRQRTFQNLEDIMLVRLFAMEEHIRNGQMV